MPIFIFITFYLAILNIAQVHCRFIVNNVAPVKITNIPIQVDTFVCSRIQTKYFSLSTKYSVIIYIW